MKGDVQGANPCDSFPGFTISTETGNKRVWKSRAALLVSKYMLLYNPNVHCAFLNNSLFGRMLNQSNPVHTFTADFYNIILTPKYHLAFPRSQSQRGISKKFCRRFLFSPLPLHPPFFHCFNDSRSPLPTTRFPLM